MHTSSTSTFILCSPWPALSLHCAAQLYAQAYCWPVFPLAGKRPLTVHGFKEATRDLKQIAAWWQRWPQANIGVPTGKGTDLVVVDVDVRHDGFASLARWQLAHGPLPATRIARTGSGGLHLYYRYPRTGRVANTTNVAGFSGIDLRGEGGYIVVPPSRHACGDSYTWLDEGSLVCLPCGFQKSVGVPHSPPPWPAKVHLSPKDATYWVTRAVLYATKGSRNSTGYWLAHRLRENVGLSQAEAEPYMQAYARSVPQSDSPYTEQEALQSLASAYR